MRFLREYAHQLGVDPRHIGTWGSSAGGHLVALLGTAGPSTGFDTGQYMDQSSGVQAVVDMFGPTDLNAMGDSNTFGRDIFAVSLGRLTPDQRTAASPITHAGPGDPPFLIFHGADDLLVRPHHSEELAQRLQVAGVPVTLVTVQHTGHSMATPGQVPSSSEVEQMVIDFFTKTLA